AERPGDLDSEAAHTTRRTYDQDELARLHVGLADGLEGSRWRDRDGCGLLDASPRPGQARPRVEGLGGPETEAGETHRVRQAGHHMPRALVDAGGGDSHQDLVGSDRWPGDPGESGHGFGCRAVDVLDDRLHRAV